MLSISQILGCTLLRPGQVFESTTCFRFSTIEAMDARH